MIGVSIRDAERLGIVEPMDSARAKDTCRMEWKRHTDAARE